LKTFLDCIPCFYRQALEAARLAGATEENQKLILDELAAVLPSLPMSSSPPEIAISIYSIVNRVTGKDDPYRELKDRSTDLALKIYGRLKTIVKKSGEPLKTAVRMAILGNIIDYGTQYSFSLEDELENIISFSENSGDGINYAVFDFSDFQQKLEKSKTLLYLADNAGETVFDRILIETIKEIYPGLGVFYAVKEKPVINDAVMADAERAGISVCARILSSGSCAPGTLLSLCSPEFLKIFENADTVISKGQGNFEVLNDAEKAIFFMFKAKCAVVARDIGCDIGDAILFYKQDGGALPPRENEKRR